MLDIIEKATHFSYLGVFLLQIAINVSPILMPPSWLVLSSIDIMEPQLNIPTLVIVGATGSLIGRMLLMYLSRIFRRFMGQERKSNLDKLSEFIKNKKHGYLIATFLFSITPLPSNMLFMAYGIMRAKSLGIFAGFWIGRVIIYYIMIILSNETIKPIAHLLGGNLIGILFIDIASMGAVVLFACINWYKLIVEKKIGFVKPMIWGF